LTSLWIVDNVYKISRQSCTLLMAGLTPMPTSPNNPEICCNTQQFFLY